MGSLVARLNIPFVFQSFIYGIQIQIQIQIKFIVILYHMEYIINTNKDNKNIPCFSYIWIKFKSPNTKYKTQTEYKWNSK